MKPIPKEHLIWVVLLKWFEPQQVHLFVFIIIYKFLSSFNRVGSSSPCCGATYFRLASFVYFSSFFSEYKDQLLHDIDTRIFNFLLSKMKYYLFLLSHIC